MPLQDPYGLRAPIRLKAKEISLHCKIKNAAMRKPGIRGSLEMASAKFFRRQAEKCAELARRTHDDESRERCEKLQRTYSHLADMEERQVDDPGSRPAA